MRKALLIAAAILATSGYAVNVQIGFSSYNHMLASLIEGGNCQSHSTPWQCVTTNICGVGGGSHFDELNSIRGAWLCERYESNGSSGPTGVSAEWEDPNNPMRIRLYEGGNSYSIDITIAEVVKCPTFGWSYPPYIDCRLEHGVFTMRGDPYSLVMNDTDKDRIVNGVMIKAGESKKLPFPFWLKMDKVDNIQFFDLTTGEEFFGQDFAGYGESGVYYKDGAYAPMWTGDFRFTDGTKKENEVPIEPLVFGDMSTSAENKLLYADNNFPIYANGKEVSTNIQLMTEWAFDHSVWGGSPKAYINDTCVCSGHSTTHIIDYTVSTKGAVFYGNGKGAVEFTMWQTPQSGYSGGSCLMRCWDKQYSSYANAPENHRAEVSAGLGVARFRVTLNRNTGEWKVEPN